jgi:hypothetical protein
MTAGEGPEAVDDLALVGSARVSTAFTEGVDMARPIWFGSRKQKAALRCAALNWTRQPSVIAAARAGEQYGVAR